MEGNSKDQDCPHIRFPEFSRRDHCGPTGTGPFKLAHQLRMLLAWVVLLPVLRVTVCALLVFLCYLGTRVASVLPKHWRCPLAATWGMLCARSVLFVLGFYHIRREYVGDHSKHDQQKHPRTPAPAIVSNHVSMWDILYHMSANYPSFVANSNISNIPFVGTIATSMGCVFIQRDKGDAAAKGSSATGNSAKIQARCLDPHAPPILIFSEGTTTNGTGLLNFKRSAFIAKMPVQPVVLQYPFRDFSPSWETITAPVYLHLMMCQWVNHLKVLYLPVYVPSEAECEDAQLYANNVRAAMAAAADLKLSDLTLADKRAYHALLRAGDKKMKKIE
mmetsp:Transcript_30422/g.58507  ORF Transcript_30422/g.58507 Transcript_30422/m.58507 type:complete len:332 (-) Transcript_30422:262-1257(-)